MAASPQFPSLPPRWKTEFLESPDRQLSLRIYRAPDLQKGRLLFLVHGQAEQSDRYEHFPHYLQSHVDAIACVDLPGHGKSQGVRGHIENFDQYGKAVLEAFQISLNWMQSQAPAVEAHWFGHSLGGLITLRTLLRENRLPLRSVSVSAPLLDLALPVPRAKKFFGELVEPFLGSLKLSNELNGDLISHDPAVSQSYNANPLNHNYLTPRFFVNLVKEMPLVRSSTGPFAYNLLMLIPLEDRIVSWKASLGFFNNLKMEAGRRKKLATFANFFHEPFNEIGKERPFVALCDWLEEN